jgi:UDP-N-acetylmuramoylalanine--D-glutamate ligase
MQKKLTILGAGESGIGAALLGKVQGFKVFVSDQGAIAPETIQLFKKENIPFEEKGHSQSKILESIEIVKSPGIPDNTEIVKAAVAQGIPVISEIEFAARYTNAKIIAITGTNGKTTTSLLTYHLLKEGGLKVGLGGNVGTSLARLVAEHDFDYYVVEVSSFQLDGIRDFKPFIGILLNITPDHLDRYDYQFSNYIDSKFRIIRNMDQHDHFLFYADSDLLRAEVEKSAIHSSLFPVSLTRNLEKGAYRNHKTLQFKPKHHLFHEFPLDKLPLPGKHNEINVLHAVLAALLAGVSWESILKSLPEFKNAPHRMEKVAVINQVEFINDSKATNVDSVIYALESYQNPVIWIAGGTDKGNDYSPLQKLSTDKIKALVCLGKDNSKIKGSFEHLVRQILDTHNIHDAVEAAFSLAEPGDTIILSPACASFDLFRNYEDRGNQFRQACLELKHNIKG